MHHSTGTHINKVSTFVEGKFFHLSLIFQSVGIFFDGVPIFWRQFVRESILTKTSIFLSGWFALLVSGSSDLVRRRHDANHFIGIHIILQWRVKRT